LKNCPSEEYRRHVAYSARVLVIARQTADSDDLLAALRERAGRGEAQFTLLVPAVGPGRGGREQAQPLVDTALARLREAGLAVEGVVGDADPVEAVAEIATPGRFDEAIVATLPGAHSKWLQFDFPHRVARITDLPVTHVIARPAGYEAHRTSPAPSHEREPLGPLSVLTWSRRES
jgi:hypothetical protein